MSSQNVLFAEESLVCPDCKGRLVPLKAKDSEHFAICDMCGNGYNTNYSPPAIYYTEKNKPIGYVSQMQKVEDKKEMIKEINEQGFIKQNDDTIYTYWMHYGKKKNSLKDIEALLHDSFYGLIVQEEEMSHTWIITKEFFEHIKSTYFFEKVKDKNKWTNPYYELYHNATPIQEVKHIAKGFCKSGCYMCGEQIERAHV